MKVISRAIHIAWTVSLCLPLPLSAQLRAEDQPAFKTFGQAVSMDELRQQQRDKFYEIEKERYQLVENSAKSAYLTMYWEREGKKQKLSPEEAKAVYMKKHAKVSDAEVKDMLKKYENHPNLKELSAKEKEDQIRSFLQQKSEGAVLQNIIDEGLKSGTLAILTPRPEEPIYSIQVTKNDHVRYAPGEAGTQPLKGQCSGDDCKITIVEYSEFQCPFCARVLPTVKQVLEQYKGKIRWVVRDFPLSFHQRARPAAIAAKCAAQQGKYWEMYNELFENQQKLGDDDLKKYAKTLKLDEQKFAECFAKSGEVEKIIDENIETGLAMGVSGTPAFFINGRRISGALPFAEFQRIIDEELSKK